MTYQVFTRSWTVRRCGRPRRFCIAQTETDARGICERRNAKLTSRQLNRGFKYEYANMQWFKESFG